MFPFVTPFPFLLDFQLYAQLLLRLTLGVYILAIGFSAQHKNIKIIASESTIAETKPELTPLQMLYRALFIVSGIALIIGLGAQIAAIIVAILMLVAVITPKARITNEVSRVELSLLLVIALTVMILPASPLLSFDLPL